MKSSPSFFQFFSVVLVTLLLSQKTCAFSLQMTTSPKTNVIAGATGYIGKSVVRESVRQGYRTIALVRSQAKVESKEGKILYGDFFEGAEVIECDVTDLKELSKVSTPLHSKILSGFRAGTLFLILAFQMKIQITIFKFLKDV